MAGVVAVVEEHAALMAELKSKEAVDKLVLKMSEIVESFHFYRDL